jgi:hypothetical protein
MRYRTFALLTLLLSMAPAVYAQETQSDEGQKPSLQQRLLPENAATLLTPAQAPLENKESQPAQPAMAARGSGTGLMIAGAALFVAGLIVGSDAGTVLAVAGAAIGAYGLYLYFQ